MLPLKDVARITAWEGKTLVNKPLVAQSSLEMPEKWAKCRQISGRAPSSRARISGEIRPLRCGLGAIRKLWILMCVLAMPHLAFGQSNQASWENLSTLRSGQKVQVVEMKSKKVSGAFVNVTETTISLQAPDGEQTISRTDVRVVKLMENKHRLRNAAIGAAVGAGVGAGAGAAIGKGNGSSGGFDFAAQGAWIVASGGAVIGAIVGALWPSHKTMYRAAGR